MSQLQLVKFVGPSEVQGLIAASGLAKIVQKALQVSCLLTNNGLFFVGQPKDMGKVLWALSSDDELVWEMQKDNPISRHTAVSALVSSPPADNQLIEQLPDYAQKMFQ
jgi:hypothetical protein